LKFASCIYLPLAMDKCKKLPLFLWLLSVLHSSILLVNLGLLIPNLNSKFEIQISKFYCGWQIKIPVFSWGIKVYTLNNHFNILHSYLHGNIVFQYFCILHCSKGEGSLVGPTWTEPQLTGSWGHFNRPACSKLEVSQIVASCEGGQIGSWLNPGLHNNLCAQVKILPSFWKSAAFAVHHP